MGQTTCIKEISDVIQDLELTNYFLSRGKKDKAQKHLSRVGDEVGEVGEECEIDVMRAKRELGKMEKSLDISMRKDAVMGSGDVIGEIVTELITKIDFEED